MSTAETELRDAVEEFERSATRLSKAIEPFSEYIEEGLPTGKKCQEAQALIAIMEIGRIASAGDLGDESK